MVSCLAPLKVLELYLTSIPICRGLEPTITVTTKTALPYSTTRGYKFLHLIKTDNTHAVG